MSEAVNLTTPSYPVDHARLDKTFTHHPPRGDQVVRYEAVRANARQLADVVMRSAPPSRETSLALTAIEEAVMWANAAIAREDMGPAAQMAQAIRSEAP
jgi:hypothetical protein